MFVAFWTVHRTAGFFITAFMKDGIDVEGYEYVAFLSASALALAVTGAGEYSLDATIEVADSSLVSLLDGWVGVGLAAIGFLGGILLLAAFWRPTQAQTDA